MIMSVTISDIAKMVGVSHSSVSRVLSNSPIRISKEKKQQILDTAKELNYIPNQSAKALKSGRHNVISVIAYDITDAFAVECMYSMEKMCSDSIYRTMWTSCAPLAQSNKGAIEFLNTIAQSSDGIIIISASRYLKDADIIRFWAGSKMPIVTVIRSVGGDLVSSVTIDDIHGASLSFEHLASKGHTDIAFFHASKENHSANLRYRTYMEKMESHSFPINKDWHFLVDGSVQGGYKAAMELTKQEKLPTAIIAFNDLTALGLIKAFYEKGIKVPEEISIASFDNIRMAENSTPGLTTVATNFDELMGFAVNELKEKIENTNKDDPAIRRYVSKPELVIRNSTSISPNSRKE